MAEENAGRIGGVDGSDGVHVGAAAEPEDDAIGHAGSKGNLHHLAGRDGHPIRHGVGEGAHVPDRGVHGHFSVGKLRHRYLR